MPIYGLRFRTLGQTGYYSGPPGLAPGDCALIEIDQGQALAWVIFGPLVHVNGISEETLPIVLRQADADDLHQGETNTLLAHEAKDFCRSCIRNRALEMKLVDVEVFFDRSKFIFYFTAPTRVDFRDLVKDLVRKYRTRIELRQIGVRHETQMVGAMGNCGMTCCCRRYLRKFAPVTIRMAKEQNLFLNPAKISGICGRLLCCLSYEQENYDNFHAQCPRIGKKYHTNKGIVKILRTNIFHNSVSFLTEDNEERTLSMGDWHALSPRRSESPQNDANRQSVAVKENSTLMESATLDIVDATTFIDDTRLDESTAALSDDFTDLSPDIRVASQDKEHHRRRR